MNPDRFRGFPCGAVLRRDDPVLGDDGAAAELVGYLEAEEGVEGEFRRRRVVAADDPRVVSSGV